MISYRCCHRAVKKLSSIAAWENSKKAAVEAELKKKEVRAYSCFTEVSVEMNNVE